MVKGVKMKKYILIAGLLFLIILLFSSLLGMPVVLGLVTIGLSVWLTVVIFKWSVKVLFSWSIFIIANVLDFIINNTPKVRTLSEIKGKLGEYFTKLELNLLDINYRVFNELYVPNDKGGTTQIDHIVTSPFGIFVIETKHYKGWIFGSENEKQWTQVIYNRREKLYNPVWQNYGHIKALKTYIGKENFEHIHSIIVFSSQSTLKFEDNFSSARVIQTPQLLKVIREWNEIKINEHELQEINQALNGLIIEDIIEKKQVMEQHVQTLKDNLKT